MSVTIETYVWGYFGFVPKSDDSSQPKDPNEAICKLCFKETGCLPKPVWISDSNTSNFLLHLCVHHTEVYSQLKAAVMDLEKSTMELYSTTLRMAAKELLFGGTVPYNGKLAQRKTFTNFAFCQAFANLLLQNISLNTYFFVSNCRW